MALGEQPADTLGHDHERLRLLRTMTKCVKFGAGVLGVWCAWWTARLLFWLYVLAKASEV